MVTSFHRFLLSLPLVLEKIYNPSLTSFVLLKNLKFFALTSRAKQITVIIDVGANIGQFSHMARYCWPGAEIFAFEPDYSSFCQLNNNHGSDCYVKSYNYAIGSSQGQLSLNIGQTTTQNSLLKEFGKVSNETRLVSVETLDNLFCEAKIFSECESDILLLKIDVQGYELEVLKGSVRFLERVDFVLVEVSLSNLFQDGAKIDEVWQFMTKNRFVYHSIIDFYQDKQSKRILQMDILFERE